MFKILYRIFLFPFLERDRYYEELVDETEIECENIAMDIINKQNKSNEQKQK